MLFPFSHPSWGGSTEEQRDLRIFSSQNQPAKTAFTCCECHLKMVQRTHHYPLTRDTWISVLLKCFDIFKGNILKENFCKTNEMSFIAMTIFKLHSLLAFFTVINFNSRQNFIGVTMENGVRRQVSPKLFSQLLSCCPKEGLLISCWNCLFSGHQAAPLTKACLFVTIQTWFFLTLLYIF